MDLVQALSIIDPHERTEESFKKAYRKACLKHHPDKGGNVEIMKLVNAAYDFLKKCDSWWTGEQIRKAKRTPPLTEVMQDLIDKIKGFQGIKIEIVGSWLWVSGETRSVKEQLKKFGFKFSYNKTAWYYHEDKKYKKHSKKKFSMEEIRSLHGSTDIKTESEKNHPKKINVA